MQHRHDEITEPRTRTRATVKPLPCSSHGPSGPSARPLRRRVALVVTSHPAQPTVAALRLAAQADERPRKDYVVLQQLLGADVIDYHHMMQQASPLARTVATRIDMALGQVLEVAGKRDRYDHIFAWADRIGAPLALAFKLAGATHDLTMVSTWGTRGRKAFFFKTLKVQSHLRAICARSLQADIMERRLGVPRAKLRVEPRGVDERFWRPLAQPTEEALCAVGWEARDYRTLIEAVRGHPAIKAELAVGAIAKPLLGATHGPVAASMRALAGDGDGDGLPANVTLTQRNPVELRALYARSRFVVVPVRDVEFDAGVTASTEAMAMGKPIIATRTPGISDLFTDREQGLFVPAGDVRAMREAIAYMLRHPHEVERMGRNARKLVERRHRFDDCMTRLAAIVTGD